MIPTHPASLVSAAQHSPAILDILDAKVSRNVVSYLVEVVSDAVDHAFSKQGPSRGRSTIRRSPAFTDFASRVLANADVPLSTVLVTIAYVQRAKPYLSIALEEWACERVFLGALVVAAKYTNDSTLKNAHWAACTQVFSTNDVSRVEREFLDVMAFELGVSEAELLPHCAELAERIHITDDHHHSRPAAATTTKSTKVASKRTSSPPRAAKWPHVKLPQPPKLPEFIRKSSVSSSSSSSSSSAPSSASSSSSSSTSTSATSLSNSTSPSAHRCPELSPHASDSDETASSPSSIQILTPPSATAAAPIHPPGIPLPLAKVSSQAGPDRGRSCKKRHSPLFPRLRSALHFHGHHHSPESRHQRHSIAVGGRF